MPNIATALWREEQKVIVWKRTAIVLGITCLLQGIIHLVSHHL